MNAFIRVSRSHLVIFLSIVSLTAYLIYAYISVARHHTQNPMDLWKVIEHDKVPPELWNRAEKIEIQHTTFKVLVHGIEITTFMRFANSYDNRVGHTPVLLLHGAAFSSKTWKDLKTIQLIAAMGHKAVAIDLPGFGETETAKVLTEKGDYLKAVIKQLEIPRPIIVVVSMSGSYVVPYVMADSPAKAWQRASGLVAIAPVGTKMYTHAQWHRVEIPVLIIRGDRDKRIGLESSSNLQNTASNKYVEFPQAGHACYMDRPILWHLTIYNYLVGIEQMKLQSMVDRMP